MKLQFFYSSKSPPGKKWDSIYTHHLCKTYSGIQPNANVGNAENTP